MISFKYKFQSRVRESAQQTDFQYNKKKVRLTYRTTNLTFLKKIKNTDPLMDAKFKSKTHLLNTFFDIWHQFLRFWFQSLKKILI